MVADTLAAMLQEYLTLKAVPAVEAEEHHQITLSQETEQAVENLLAQTPAAVAVAAGILVAAQPEAAPVARASLLLDIQHLKGILCHLSAV